MKVRVKGTAASFEAGVFGGHCFLRNFPEITTTGVEVERAKIWNGRIVYYVLVNGERAHYTSFFTAQEFRKYLEVVQ